MQKYGYFLKFSSVRSWSIDRSIFTIHYTDAIIILFFAISSVRGVKATCKGQGLQKITRRSIQNVEWKVLYARAFRDP